MRIRLALIAVIAVVMGLLAVLAVRTKPGRDDATLRSEPTARVTVDRTDRRAVIDAFYDVWLHNQRVPLGWSGDASDCRPGTISADAELATRQQINYFRSLVGLRGVSFDGDLQATAQRTALMMDANNQLSHFPPDSWECRTAAADDLASRSNLALGSGARGASAISLYVQDPGSSNTAVGHRRWLLNPRTAVMSSGSTARANALVVVGMPQHDGTVPRWMPWPSPGYFPSPLEPHGRWSLSASSARTDFSRAVVRVTDGAGHRYPVSRYAPEGGMGPATLVWRVGDLRRPTASRDVTYRVSVSRIRRGGVRIPAVAYSVTLVKPDRRLSLVSSPVVKGSPAVGEELIATPGSWSPNASSASFQWYRDGVAIDGAHYPFYRVQSGDAGRELTVRVLGRAAYYLPGSARVTVRVARS
jgi:uncharacterized protein YkwD